MSVAHLDFDGFGGVSICAMASSLFDKLTAMYEYQSLCSIWVRWRYSVDKLSENDLIGVSERARLQRCRLTVLPLPVASDIPSRLWPFAKYDNTD